MAREETLRDVPSDRVGTVAQGFTDDGARKVSATKNTNGKWDITAHFD